MFFDYYLTKYFLVRETLIEERSGSVVHDQVEESADLGALMTEVDDDKCFAAMSIAKTISTVTLLTILAPSYGFHL